MRKSPTRSATEIVLIYAILAGGWILFSHLGPQALMVIDAQHVHHDAPADTILAAVTAVVLFWLVRRNLTAEADAHEALRRSHDELESRVQQRTQALDDERAKLLRILDAMPDGICIINEQNEMEYVNPVMQERWGSVGQQKCYTYFENRDEPCPHCRYHQIASGQTLNWEWLATQDQRAYEIVGTPLRELDGTRATLHIFRDITERKQAAREQARLVAQIEAERKLFQAVVENAPASIALFDGAELSIKWANPQYQQALPPTLRVTDISGLPFEALYPDEYGCGIHDIFHRVASTGQSYIDPEFVQRASNQNSTYWQWSLLPLPADEDRVPDLLLVAHEVTGQVFARKHTEELNAEAERRAQELHEAHAQLSIRARELTTLLDISRSLASTLQSRPLFEDILEQLKIMIDYSTAIVYTSDDEGITAVAYRGELPQESVLGLHIPTEHAPGFQAVIRRRDAVIVDDLRAEESLATQIISIPDERFLQTVQASRSWMGVPMMIDNRVVGLIRLDHVQPGFFGTHEAQIALAIANQATIAMENSRLYEQARKVATLEERQRMARELHDSVSQALYGIALGTHAAREQLVSAPEMLNGTLDYILTMSATAVSEMRALIFELRPDSLEQEGLVAALSRQADAFQARASVVTHLDLCGEPDAMSLDGKESLYRIAQEALQNIAKHAQARNVHLRLYREMPWIVLEVSDDGIGFDPNGRFPGHIGLQSMHERAVRMGGTLEFESIPDAGTMVRARIPAEQQAIEPQA